MLPGAFEFDLVNSVDILTFPMTQVIEPFALVDVSILVDYTSHAVAFAICVISLVAVNTQFLVIDLLLQLMSKLGLLIRKIWFP